MDLIVAGVIFGGTYIGYKRGLILELTDWAIMLFASFAAFRGFRPFAKFIHSWIPGWPLPNCYTIAFWFLLLSVGLVIVTIGLHIDRATREFDRIPPEVRNYGGGTVAFFKCIVIACLLTVTLPQAGGLTDAERQAVKRSGSANLMRSLSAPVGVMVSVVAPADLATKFKKNL